jgi:hypothetical protein
MGKRPSSVPCWISNQHQKHKSGRGPSSEHFWQVWLKSVQRFQRRRFKCEKLTNGRRTLTHDKSSHGLWPGELKITTLIDNITSPVEYKIAILIDKSTPVKSTITTLIGKSTPVKYKITILIDNNTPVKYKITALIDKTTPVK